MTTSPTKGPGKKVIILNGPPGVGKDTAANAMCGYISKHAQYMQPRHMKIAEPLKKAAHALVDAFPSWDYFDQPEFAKLKDRPSGDFMGMTPRELYDKLDVFARTVFGDAFFGMIMRKRMHKAQGCQVVVISNTGPIEEITNIIDYVQPENVMIIELYSTGKDFPADSDRGYIGEVVKELYPKVKVMRLTNDFGDAADKELFRIYCQGAAKSFLKIEEKQGVL